MRAATIAVLLAVAAIGAWAMSRAADAAALPAAEGEGAAVDLAMDFGQAPAWGTTAEPTNTDASDGTTALDYLNPWGWIESMTNSSTAADALADANVRAFLDAIAWAEGTDRAADPYRVTFGYGHTIRDLSDHPAVTGEWTGRTFTNAKGRQLLSTAAGRYQFLRGTWLECKRALRLPDFGQASQDAACVYLIKRRGALDAVRAGRIAEAAELCRREWASLPGAGYAQPERTLAALLDRYADQGGTLA